VTRQRAARGPAIAAWLWLGPCACTEPNPYLPAAAAGTSTSTSTGDSSTTVPATGTGIGTDDGASSSGGEPSCTDQGMECVAAAPEGFFGPFAWLEGSTAAPLACAAPFERERAEAFSEISAPAAGCDCDCGALTNASCDGDAAVDRHSGVSCAGAVQDTLDLDPGCNPVGGLGWSSSTSFFFDAPAMVSGSCLPLLTVDREPATFLTRHLACMGALAAAGCEPGQLCAPPPADPFHARWCVGQEADIACPEDGAYTERTLLHRDIDDQRGCQPCMCTVPPGPCEGSSAVLATAADCSVIVSAVLPDDCVGGLGGSAVMGVFYVEGSPPRACDPAVVVPTGDAAGVEPVTFCCTP
jgi:hypothetical protein